MPGRRPRRTPALRRRAPARASRARRGRARRRAGPAGRARSPRAGRRRARRARSISRPARDRADARPLPGVAAVDRRPAASRAHRAAGSSISLDRGIGTLVVALSSRASIRRSCRYQSITASPAKRASTPPSARNGANGIAIFRAAAPCRAKQDDRRDEREHHAAEERDRHGRSRRRRRAAARA